MHKVQKRYNKLALNTKQRRKKMPLRLKFREEMLCFLRQHVLYDPLVKYIA